MQRLEGPGRDIKAGCRARIGGAEWGGMKGTWWLVVGLNVHGTDTAPPPSVQFQVRRAVLLLLSSGGRKEAGGVTIMGRPGTPTLDYTGACSSIAHHTCPPLDSRPSIIALF